MIKRRFAGSRGEMHDQEEIRRIKRRDLGSRNMCVRQIHGQEDIFVFVFSTVATYTVCTIHHYEAKESFVDYKKAILRHTVLYNCLKQKLQGMSQVVFTKVKYRYY
jgi:hypothetical protein